MKKRTKRPKVLKRDKGICLECGLDCLSIDTHLKYLFTICIYTANDYMRNTGLTSLSAWHAHHIVELQHGGLDVLDNLITLCQWCHNKHHYNIGALVNDGRASK